MIIKRFFKIKKETMSPDIGRKAYTTHEIMWKGVLYPENTEVVITEVDSGSCGRGYGFMFPDGNRIAETGWYSERFEDGT